MDNSFTKHELGSNVKMILDIKDEYINKFINITRERFKEGYQSIYDNVRKNNKVPKLLLKEFQDKLKLVPLWSEKMIEDEFNRIKVLSQCDFLEQLIEALFSSYSQMFMLVNKKEETPIKIPSQHYVIHSCYIEVARALWKKPQLYYHRYDVKMLQILNNELDTLIYDSINTSIKKLIPFKELLNNYLEQKDTTLDNLNNLTISTNNQDEDDEDNEDDDISDNYEVVNKENDIEEEQQDDVEEQQDDVKEEQDDVEEEQEDIEEEQQDIEEQQDDVEEQQDDVKEEQDDVEEEQEDIEEQQDDVEEQQDDVEEEQEDIEEQQEDIEEQQEDIEEQQDDVEEEQEDIEDINENVVEEFEIDEDDKVSNKNENDYYKINKSDILDNNTNLIEQNIKEVSIMNKKKKLSNKKKKINNETKIEKYLGVNIGVNEFKNNKENIKKMLLHKSIANIN